MSNRLSYILLILEESFTCNAHLLWAFKILLDVWNEQETPMIIYLNTHAALEQLRIKETSSLNNSQHSLQPDRSPEMIKKKVRRRGVRPRRFIIYYVWYYQRSQRRGRFYRLTSSRKKEKLGTEWVWLRVCCEGRAGRDPRAHHPPGRTHGRRQVHRQQDSTQLCGKN